MTRSERSIAMHKHPLERCPEKIRQITIFLLSAMLTLKSSYRKHSGENYEISKGV